MSSKHTICLLNDSFPPTIDGVANAVYNYARIIEKEHGHSIVVTPQVPGADDSKDDFSIVRYPSIDTRKLIGYVTGYPFSPEAAHKIKAEHAEVLHTHCPVTSCLLARQLSQSMDLPLILTYHTKYDIDIANAVRSKHLQKNAVAALLHNINACNEVWTVSKGAGENLRSIGYEGDYIVMHNGVDLPRGRVSSELVNEVTSDYNLPYDVPCYIFIGRLMWYKGLRIILDALASLHSSGIDFRMVFVGGGGDEAEVKAYAENLGLNTKIFFTGAVYDRDRLRAWYTRADLFLFPSTFDTNGLVVREAAASDTASVIIESSCASEGISDNVNGFLIEENAESLSARLAELILEPARVQDVGRAAGKDLYISWEDAVRHACDRYEIVIDRYKSGLYGTKLPYDYDFFRSQGELMQILGNINAIRVGTLEAFEATRKGILNSIEAGQREFLSNVDYIQSEITTAIREAEEEFWDRLDRYL